MPSCDDLKLAHGHFMAHEDLYTKWDNAATLSHSLLVTAFSQLVIHSDDLARSLGPGRLRAGGAALSLIGLFLSAVWLATNFRNFYWLFARYETMLELEQVLEAGGQAYGFLRRDDTALKAMTTGTLSEVYRKHRQKYGLLLSAIGAFVCWTVVSWWSTRYRLICIPLLFTAVWMILLYVGLQLPVGM